MIDTTHLIVETDINEALIKLDNKIMEWYNECCPIKTKVISCKAQIKPSINQSIKIYILKRQNIYELFQRSLISEGEYKLFHNFVDNQIRIAKKKHYEKVFHENRNNLRQTWNVINKVLSKTSNRSRLEIKTIVSDNRIYTDGFEICEIFNDFFTSVSSRVHESIPPLMSEDEFSYYLQDIQVNTFFELSPIHIDEI